MQKLMYVQVETGGTRRYNGNDQVLIQHASKINHKQDSTCMQNSHDPGTFDCMHRTSIDKLIKHCIATTDVTVLENILVLVTLYQTYDCGRTEVALLGCLRRPCSLF
jgi:hypothetical protein